MIKHQTGDGETEKGDFSFPDANKMADATTGSQTAANSRMNTPLGEDSPRHQAAVHANRRAAVL
ncbi:hypothetical protein [Streptomyces sp. NPDC059224]|uniref:hypothetical protein n=1 Tax=Streptomyces sp. NPDC059224 TaxID=3346775 RepID=UPI0036CEE39A